MNTEGNIMNKGQYIQRILAVVNTLNAATVRADQVDAVQRIAACTRELNSIVAELNTPEDKGE